MPSFWRGRAARKKRLRAFISETFGYDLSRSCDDIRPTYTFNATCQGTVPEAITAFLEGENFEDVIRTAVTLGGDCDTLTCIAGSIAEAFYGVPPKLVDACRTRLPENMLTVIDRFQAAVQPFHDHTLDGNVVIEQAIEAHRADSTTENLAEILAAIHNRMLADGHVLVPVLADEDERCFHFRTMTIEDGSEWMVLFTSMAAYVLASSTFRYRYQVSFFFYFTSIFGGGLVPWYIFNTKYLHFHNSVIALILPILINVTYLLILKSYMAGIPEALYESARLDGAGDFTIYLRVAMPLCKAGLATVGLFIALNYWNDWYDAMLFLDEGRSDLYPLQYFLYQQVNDIEAYKKLLANNAAGSAVSAISLPTQSLKMALTIVVTGPIVLAYPLVQKNFVQGITIGAVKG